MSRCRYRGWRLPAEAGGGVLLQLLRTWNLQRCCCWQQQLLRVLVAHLARGLGLQQLSTFGKRKLACGRWQRQEESVGAQLCARLNAAQEKHLAQNAIAPHRVEHGDALVVELLQQRFAFADESLKTKSTARWSCGEGGGSQVEVATFLLVNLAL